MSFLSIKFCIKCGLERGSKSSFFNPCYAELARERRKLPPKPGTNPTKECTVHGCSRKIKAKNFCDLHYYRFSKFGSTDLPKKPIINRYKRISKVGHPLTTVKGFVYEHRAILYDKIGKGPHYCYWCDKTIGWTVGVAPEHDSIVVDHLDRNRRNNETNNLVPSCPKCNSSRSHGNQTEVFDKDTRHGLVSV